MTDDFESMVRFKASPGAVFDALTTPSHLAGWWAPVSGSGLEGGELRFLFGDDPLMIRVDQAERPSAVKWTALAFDPLPDWVATTMTFEITPTQTGGARLQFRHTGMTPTLECFDTCTAGWAQYLASLVDYVDEGTGNAFGSTTDTRAEHWEGSRAAVDDRPHDSSQR